MVAKVFSTKNGLVAVDLLHCALDHLSAAELLFNSTPDRYDSAGYLAHLGVELLLKSWSLHGVGEFEGVHRLEALYDTLIGKLSAPALSEADRSTLRKLDTFAELRYPNRNEPTPVGTEDWDTIRTLVGAICNSMPNALTSELEKIEPGNKGGRVLLRKRKDAAGT